MAALIGVEGRDSHEAMNSPLSLAKAVGVLAPHKEGRALDPGGLTGQHVSQIDFPSPRLKPSLVHAQEHLRPIASLGPAGAGVDAEDAIVFIVGAVKKDL